MFDGIPPTRRRRMTERERKALMRMERAVYAAQFDAWKAKRQAARVERKFARYAQQLNQRLGPGGPGDTGGALITEWLLQEMNAPHD